MGAPAKIVADGILQLPAVVVIDVFRRQMNHQLQLFVPMKILDGLDNVAFSSIIEILFMKR